MNFWGPKNRDYVQTFKKKGEKVEIQGEQRRIVAIYFLAVKILLHIHVEDFITYPWTPRTCILEFIWIFESQKTETMSKLSKKSENDRVSYFCIQLKNIGETWNVKCNQH